MRYCAARLRQTQEEKAYRLYVTDSLWGLARGRALEARFFALLHPTPQETRAPEEIIAHIRGKLREV